MEGLYSEQRDRKMNTSPKADSVQLGFPLCLVLADFFIY